MYLEDAKIFQGNQFIQFSAVLLSFSLIFLGVMQFFRSDIGLTSFGSLIRLLGSFVLLVEIFYQGERRGLFSRYFNYSDIFCIVLGVSGMFFGGFSLLSVGLTDISLSFNPMAVIFLDLSLSVSLVFQLIDE